MATSSSSVDGYEAANSDSEQTTTTGSSSCKDLELAPTTVTATTFLEKLRCPNSAEIGRKRKVRCNQLPPSGTRRGKARSTHDPKSVVPLQRVGEFPNELLTVSAGRLFCSACREELSLKTSVIRYHLKSDKHQEGKKRRTKKECRERDIADALTKHNESTHQEGESLPIDQQVYRVKVASTFLRAAVPISKLDQFRDILQENALRLTDRSHMANLIPFILKEEQERIKHEIDGKRISLVFDGTSRLGEAMVVLIRYVSDNWELEQRLLRVQMLEKSMTGEEIARVLIEVLSVGYGVSSTTLLAAMRDRASVNNVAMRTVKVIFPLLVDVGCFSNTINLAGEHFKIPVLSEFILSWVSIFAHSAKAKLCWKEQVGVSPLAYCPTRWWSQWEVMHQLMVYFGDVEQFLTSNEMFAPATKPKLLFILTDTCKSASLQMELAAVVDAGESLVKATYVLEGDGPLVLECYEIMSTVLASIQAGYYPNVEAVSRKLSPGNSAAQRRWVTYALQCVEPGLEYFADALNGSLSASMKIFKAARVFNPKKAAEMQPNASVLDCLTVVPFLHAATIGNLKSELPLYLAKVADISPNFSPLQWWQMNAEGLPHWSAAARKILLIQPSSAAAERVFSLLSNSFNQQQYQALQDYVELSLMLQYNKR